MRKPADSSRRNFLKKSGIATLGFMGLQYFVANPLLAAEKSSYANQGYGPLLPDPYGIINLPKGFSYRVISRKGDMMSDGLLVPGSPDGMATFQGPNGRTIIVRNHEISSTPGTGAFGAQNQYLKNVDKSKFYDFGKGVMPELGGTTTLVYNPATGEVEKEFLSLVGTIRNCAGGTTPWNTWITCEETTVRPNESNLCEKDHGYNFEVPASDRVHLTAAVPIKAMGRMNHEAVAVDPRTGIVYMTEDTGDSLIYRYLPNSPGELLKGGKLQALVVREQKSADTRNWENLQTASFPTGKPFESEWIDLEDAESPNDDLRYQGFEKGAARFARGEGMWFGNNEVYFACTNGGKLGHGQVFRYIPSIYEGQHYEKTAPGTLELFVEPNDTTIANACDALTVAPWGDLILCEDNPAPFIVGITPKGEFYKLAQNVGYKCEFAGGVFSPTGETYFVNLQGAGMTVAITGPWKMV